MNVDEAISKQLWNDVLACDVCDRPSDCLMEALHADAPAAVIQHIMSLGARDDAPTCAEAQAFCMAVFRPELVDMLRPTAPVPVVCEGCRSNCANQLAHMVPGGCLEITM